MVEKCLSTLSRDMENIEKAQIGLPEIKDIMPKVKPAIYQTQEIKRLNRDIATETVQNEEEEKEKEQSMWGNFGWPRVPGREGQKAYLRNNHQRYSKFHKSCKCTNPRNTTNFKNKKHYTEAYQHQLLNTSDHEKLSGAVRAKKYCSICRGEMNVRRATAVLWGTV